MSDEKNLGDCEPEEEEEEEDDEIVHLKQEVGNLQSAFDRVVGQKQFMSIIAEVLGILFLSGLICFVWPVPHWSHFGLGVRRPAVVVSESTEYKAVEQEKARLAEVNSGAEIELAGLKRQISELEAKLAAQPKTEIEVKPELKGPGKTDAAQPKKVTTSGGWKPKW